MRFLVDECTGPAVARWLHREGYDVLSVYDEHRGLDDGAVLQLALAQSRVLITNDKDFGRKVFREKRPHKGVVLLRLDDERAPNKIRVVRRFLQENAHRVEGAFVSVSERHVRWAL